MGLGLVATPTAAVAVSRPARMDLGLLAPPPVAAGMVSDGLPEVPAASEARLHGVQRLPAKSTNVNGRSARRQLSIKAARNCVFEPYAADSTLYKN